jgi:epsilon-lactone hydrolase
MRIKGVPHANTSPQVPFVSPLYAGLAGWPPLYIQAWSDETLLEGSRLFADRARQAPTSASICSPDSSTPSRWPWAARRTSTRRLADLARSKLGP